jgi:hypothetical protein
MSPTSSLTGDTTISSFLATRARLGHAPTPSGTIGTVPASAPGVTPPCLAPPRRRPTVAWALRPPTAADAAQGEDKTPAAASYENKTLAAGSGSWESAGGDSPSLNGATACPPTVLPLSGGSAAPPPAVLPLGQCRPVTLPYISYEEAPGTPSLLELLSPAPPTVFPPGAGAPPTVSPPASGAASPLSWLPPVFGLGGGGGKGGGSGGDAGGRIAPSRFAAAGAARDFFLHLALNHSVMPEIVNGEADLCASSPDEVRLCRLSPLLRPPPPSRFPSHPPLLLCDA